MSEMFTDKVVLVTGGNSGIGKATAIGFAKEGAKVVIAARREAEGQQVVQQIQELGGEALFIKADVSIEADVQQMTEATVERYGKIDCAFNNVGISARGLVHEIDEQTWDRVINVNLKGIWLCMKYQIDQFLKQDSGGVICNNASTAGLSGWNLSPVYAATKHGVVGLTKSAALQYAEQNIRINAICPASVRTPLLEGALKENPKMEQFFLSMEPMGRMSSPEEIADVAVWICSDKSSFVTGVALPVDGGALAGLWPDPS